MKNFQLLVFAVLATVSNDAAALEALRQKMQGFADKIDGILNKAEAESRDLTPQELGEIRNLSASIENVKVQMDAKQTVLNLAKPSGAASREGVNAPAVILDMKKGKGSFKNMGEFAGAIKDACSPSAKLDQRLVRNAPTSYTQEMIGEDGGFLVPDDFRAEIWEKVNSQDSLLARCDTYETSKSSIAIPQDSVAPWDNTNGIQAYWDGEADQINQSKPKFKLKKDSLHRLTALVPVSEEVLEDAPMLGSYLMRKAPEKMDFKISRAIYAGTGAGEPKGILLAASTVSVAKESGQTADTILFQNIVKMYSRLASRCIKNAVWLANQDTLPQLMQMVSVSSAGLNMPVYIPPGGLSAAPYGTLMGRPVIHHEVCETLGDKGDIMLVDFSQYLAATKAGGIKADTSMHLYFDYNMQAFRFTFRMAGSPWWDTTITPRSGSSNTLGSAVVLDARA